MAQHAVSAAASAYAFTAAGVKRRAVGCKPRVSAAARRATRSNAPSPPPDNNQLSESLARQQTASSASPSSALIPRSRVRSCACWKRCERTAQRGLNCSRATVAAAQLNSATPRLHLSDLSSRSRQALGSTSISSRNSRLPVFATKRVKLHCAARRRVRSESVQVCAVTQVA